MDYLLLRLKQKLIALPLGVDIVTFMEMDGRPPEEAKAVPKRVPITLGVLRDRYLETHRGALEGTTIDGIQLHFKHLVSTLGERFPIQELSLSNLQEHADRRKKMKGIRGKLSSASLRTAWNWGVHMGLVIGRFPALKRVKMPKPKKSRISKHGRKSNGKSGHWGRKGSPNSGTRFTSPERTWMSCWPT